MCRKLPCATGGQWRRQTSASVCLKPCLILCLAYVERSQARPLQHHQRTRTARGRRPAGRLSGAARTGDAAWQAAPPSRHRRPAHHTASPPRAAHHRVSARRAGPQARRGWTHGSPQAWRTRPAHRQAHRRPTARDPAAAATSANLPQKAAHTATGGASGRNRSRSPLMGPDVGLRGARRRPHGGHRTGSGWTRITPDRSPPRWRVRQPRWPRPPGIAAAHAPAPTRDRPVRSSTRERPAPGGRVSRSAGHAAPLAAGIHATTPYWSVTRSTLGGSSSAKCGCTT